MSDNLPLVTIFGRAGSGKDTLGQALAQHLDGQCIGFADALKQMAREVFGFTEQQLFGPSKLRDTVDSRFTDVWALKMAGGRLLGPGGAGEVWIDKLRMPSTPQAKRALELMWRRIEKQAQDAGGLSPRYVLQLLGTEWGRQQAPRVWIDRTLAVVDALLSGEATYTRMGGLVQGQEVKVPGVVVITDGRFPNECAATKQVNGVAVEVQRPDADHTAKTGMAGHASEAAQLKIPPHWFNMTLMNVGTIEDLQAIGIDALARRYFTASRMVCR